MANEIKGGVDITTGVEYPDLDGNGVLDLDSAEVTQLANIGSTTISADQWIYLGDMNQSLASTDDVTFNDITGTGKLFLNDEATALFPTADFQMFKNIAADITLWSANATAATDADINLVRSRGTIASPLAVQDGDLIGNVNFIGASSASNFNNGAEINAEINGSVSAGVLPCDLVFCVNAGAGAATEGMRLLKTKDLQVVGYVKADSLKLNDSNDTNLLDVSWGDNDTSDRTLQFLVNGANRRISLEADVILDQDYTTDASVRFGALQIDNLSMDDNTVSSLNSTDLLLAPATDTVNIESALTNATTVLEVQGNGIGNAQFSIIHGSQPNSTILFTQTFNATNIDFGTSVANFTINNTGEDCNTIIEGDTDANLVTVDAGTDTVCIGGTTTTQKFNVVGNTNISGYVNQAGIFAEIYLADESTSQEIAAGATYTKSTAFTTNGQSSNCTADATNDKITITQIGRYSVSGSFSAVSGTANVTWRGAAFLNGVEQNQVHWKRKMTTNTDAGEMGFTGFIDVTTAPWDLDFRLRHDNGGAVDFTIEYGNLNVEYMGAT